MYCHTLFILYLLIPICVSAKANNKAETGDSTETVDPSILLATTTPGSTVIITTNNNNNNGGTDTSNILKLTIVNPTTPNVPTATETSMIPTTKTSTYHQTTGVTTTVSEDSNDQDLFKLILTIQEGDSYYNAAFQVGSNSSSGKNSVDLRLDLIQPELWVMNGNNFYDCNFINQWFSSEEQIYHSTSVYPAAVTTEPEYTATVCGQGGLYFTPTGSVSGEVVLPTATINGVINGDPYIIPYMNVIEATGTFETDDIYFNITNGQQVLFSNFTFINVNETNMYFGGLGLSGLPKGSGFLYTLAEMGIIRSPSYSLWFNNNTEGTTDSFGELLPGVVDQKYYSGDFYAFDIPDHSGIRFPNDNNLDEYSNNALNDLVLPILQLDDLLVENQLNGETISLQSTPGEAIALLLDSRSSYNYIPLDMIVNLAVQTNAYYSNEAERWIVQCDVITNSDATLNFMFGGLEIPIPLQEFMVDANYYGKTLKFSNGQKACYLTFLPSSLNGFNSLGLPFLTNIYLAVDNAGKSIGLANANRNLQVQKGSLQPTGKVQPFSLPGSTSALSFSTVNSTNVSATAAILHSSIGYIQSGYIPFATSQLYTADVTLTYSSVDSAEESGAGVDLDIPARFSGAVIRSGEIIITAGATNSLPYTTTTLLPVVASAASENATTTSKNDAASLHLGGNGSSKDMKRQFKQLFVILSVFIFSICIL